MRGNFKKVTAALLTMGIILSGCNQAQNKKETEEKQKYATEYFTKTPGTQEYSDKKTDLNMAVAPEKSDKKSVLPEPTLPSADINSADRKLTKNGSISLSVEDITDVDKVIQSIAEKSGGYVFSVDQNEYSGRRTLNITIKVASAQFDSVISSLKELGKVLNTKFTVDDLTMEYADTEAMISTLKTKEERLNSILEKATKIEDILAIENQLQMTRQELMSASSRMSILKNQTDYSTIYISVSDSKNVTQNPPENLLQRLVRNLKNGLEYWSRTLTDLLSTIIFALPVIILASLVIVLLRKRRRRGMTPVSPARKASDNVYVPEKVTETHENDKKVRESGESLTDKGDKKISD